MILTNPRTWETATGVVLLAALTGAGIWLLTRRRLTADEIEQARRQFLARSGRLVDGMFLDITEMTAEEGAGGATVFFGNLDAHETEFKEVAEDGGVEVLLVIHSADEGCDGLLREVENGGVKEMLFL